MKTDSNILERSHGSVFVTREVKKADIVWILEQTIKDFQKNKPSLGAMQLRLREILGDVSGGNYLKALMKIDTEQELMKWLCETYLRMCGLHMGNKIKQVGSSTRSGNTKPVEIGWASLQQLTLRA